MSTYERFHGIMPPILTPMDERGEIDERSLRSYINFLVDGGINALVVNGTMGEFYALTEAERARLVKVVVEEVHGKIPVVVGTGHSGTKLVVELSRAAEDAGADAVQIMPPYYVVPTDEGIVAHYDAVSRAISIPIFVYNNVGTTKIDLSPKLMATLADLPRVAGIKLSPGSKISPLEGAMELRRLTPHLPDLVIMIATTSLWFYGLEAGVSNGCVMGLPNVFPREFSLVYKQMKQGEVSKARVLNRSFYELDHLALTALGGRARYQYVYKTLLVWKGIMASARVREPMTPVGGEIMKLVRSAFESLQL